MSGFTELFIQRCLVNDLILQRYDNIQIADLDDDIIGLCKAFIEFLQEVRALVPNAEYPNPSPPEKFYKLSPHFPKMEQRKNYRKFLSYAVRRQQEENENVKLLNMYAGVLAGMYIYHMPVEEMIKLSELSEEISRKQIETILLDDKMSPNWIKEPSGKDFSAIML